MRLLMGTSMVTVWRLCDGPMRTAQLRRSVPGITERMLIRHLHELVDDGIIERHDARTVPPRVHYSISEYGMTLAPVLASLCDWGRKHMQCNGVGVTQGAD
jgi:DNA-binding HxlR family transcriptional regulator